VGNRSTLVVTGGPCVVQGAISLEPLGAAPRGLPAARHTRHPAVCRRRRTSLPLCILANVANVWHNGWHEENDRLPPRALEV
jgi:hypothetical protein